jgi:hypothetical protein
MRNRNTVTTLAAAAAGAALIVALAAGCSSEQSTRALNVTATPNPVTGTDDSSGRLWEFKIAIANPNPVGLHVENFHIELTNTDTGYAVPLVLVKEDSEVIGAYVASGGTLSYAASRESAGRFSRGRERRIYHALGDDGVYYSGEVLIDLQ